MYPKIKISIFEKLDFSQPNPFQIITELKSKMKFISSCHLFLFLQCLLVKDVFSYTIDEILKDNEEFQTELHELIKYRGPLLGDVWTQSVTSEAKEKEVCDKLFGKALEAATVTWPPPRKPPAELRDAYTIGGRMHFHEYFLMQQQNGGRGYDWSTPVMESYRAKNNTCGGYDLDFCDIIMSRYAEQLIEGKSTLVVGSQSPWAEAALYNSKARHVTTVEYMRIHSDYQNFTYLHPSDIARKYLDRKWEAVDVGFSYSSVEHDGLGRYGDPLNPFADLESVARIRCLLKPGGYLFLGFPLSADELWWNAHRLYGRYRLFLMLMGWRLVDLHPQNCIVHHGKVQPGYWLCQPLILLQKTEGMDKSSNYIPQGKSEGPTLMGPIDNPSLRGNAPPPPPPAAVHQRQHPHQQHQHHGPY